MKDRLIILKNYFRARYGYRFSSREQLLAWQDKQVQRFLSQIVPRSPFYRRHYAGLATEQWQTWPLIDKKVMMANFDTLNTVGIGQAEALAVALRAEQERDFSPTIKGITVGLSSGTSGHRGLFLVSPQERFQWGGTILGKLLPGSIFARHRVAFFLRANSNLFRTVQSRRIQFEYFDLLSPLTEQIERLNEFQPTILSAPPSMLRFLAQAIGKGQLLISPQKLISVAEVLDPLDEVFIAQQFGQRVHQVYQCTEGFLGATCSYGTLHLNEDIVAVQREYLDSSQRKFMPIITDFRRTTQPIIRYRLDDILTERATPCPCGSVLTALESIEGRKDDIFYLPARTGNQWIPIFPDFIRRAIITQSADLKAYRVYQVQPTVIEIRLLESTPKIQALILQSLKALFARLGCLIPEIRFIPLPLEQEIPGPDKLRRVVRCFEQSDLSSTL